MTALRYLTTWGPVGALLFVVAFAMTACSPAGLDDSRPAVEDEINEPSSDVASRPSTTATPRLFESAQHGYRLEIPTDWEFVEGAGTWIRFDQFVPGSQVPGEDLASTTDGFGWLVANSMLLPKEMTREEWLTELDELVGSGPLPDCREQRRADVLAGEQATVTRHRCDDLTIVGSSLVHANRGYYFTVGYTTGDASTESRLEEIASSIRFTK
ncbi:hypothetical protein EKO23_22820 [Nocardioides guangzhouensis]|uniref:Uncharacterized protein n=1 Tax=Nocardioides guangzhouensis TaxID=2497878 RepID=A0A4Q4Z2S9_9ACTN|nr:hypothetical protein [Nocardioides guangzhouensis]RYP81923.1 hypothetical protein EKO23_22820 [Nocardioides guangzhouensis]